MTKNEIMRGLKQLGLKPGDIVLLHSSLSSLGHVTGGVQTVVDAFLDVLGEQGTLAAPTFGALGVIADLIGRHPRAVRSVQPYASLAAIGARAEEICRDHWKAETAHAENTPYLRIAEMGGYVCLLGVDQDRNTTLHTVEELLRLPYLQSKQGAVTTEAGQISREWKFFPGPHRDFIGLDRLLRESGKMKITQIGSAVTRLIKSRDLIDLALAVGRENPAFVLCDNPNCADCVMQRAELVRHRLAGESFLPVASAGLAGRYVPEMIDNLKAAGIGAVELDYLEGRPAHGLPKEKIGQATAALREAGIKVAALRSVVAGSANSALLETAQTYGVPRVVVPLGGDAAELAKAAMKQKITIAFYNHGWDSCKVSALLLELQAKKMRFGFVFNAAAFAAVGEKPFLGSYKQKLRRFIDQLDVEDALFDGAPANLAEGNAEIKEMISILRCAGFSGFMTLGLRNRFVATLANTVARFMDLLTRM